MTFRDEMPVEFLQTFSPLGEVNDKLKHLGKVFSDFGAPVKGDSTTLGQTTYQADHRKNAAS
jgi:hypothetical protein